MNSSGFEGGRGSVLAVSAQNPGPDGQWGTTDDLLTPVNTIPSQISIDWTPGPDNMDQLDRVRGFHSQHISGAVFSRADGSVSFIVDSIDQQLFRHLSTMAGGEVVVEFD